MRLFFVQVQNYLWSFFACFFVMVEVLYEGGSICNENPFITPSTNTL